MELIPMFLKELEQEAQTTRKMLALIPDDRYDWQPHPKSMTLRRLGSHIAELPGWVTMAIKDDGLDFASSPYKVPKIDHTKDLLAFFEANLASGKASLENAYESAMSEKWVLRNGDTILQVYTRAEVIRMSYCQTVHHRAQLGVFLRLLDIPIPGSYGPSADEMAAMADFKH